MTAFHERVPIDADVIKADLIQARGAIAWAARDNTKPGRSGPEAWVIQASPDWSRAHLEAEADDVARRLLTAFAEATRLTLPPPLAARAHRWRYAMSGRPPEGDEGPVWNATLSLGLCGDWTIGPRIEAAWLSGDGLARLISI